MTPNAPTRPLAAALAAGVGLVAALAPAAPPDGVPAAAPIASWEGAPDGWAVHEANADAAAFDGKVGVTEGASSLALDVKGGYRVALVREGIDGAALLRDAGGSIAMDVTAAFDDVPAGWLRVDVVVQGTGLAWTPLGEREVKVDGRTQAVGFEIDPAKLPQNPDYFQIFIVTNTGDAAADGEPKTIYLDHLRAGGAGPG